MVKTSQTGSISNTPTPHNRFTSQSETAEDLLSKQTQGLVALSDFRKRRAEVIEAKERDAQASLRLSLNGGSGRVVPSENSLDTPGENNPPKFRSKKDKKQKTGNLKLSFQDDEDPVGDNEETKTSTNFVSNETNNDTLKSDRLLLTDGRLKSEPKVPANANLSIKPRPLTKGALLREERIRENLRKEYLLLQEKIKSTEIEIPFVFYDGTNIPGGTCRVRKGDYIWVFLDRSRKAGAELKIGERANSKRQWARIGVDDLMLVKGDLIIPHHYDFYYFIINRIHGPNNQVLFNYSSDFSPVPSNGTESVDLDNYNPLSRPSSFANRKSESEKAVVLEGTTEDPTLTKVVDRRWYERNKHIFPASVWQEFDPEKDYQKEIKRDLGGNAFFFT
ncbi:putative xap5 domain containing protein [Erysiphe necator]|uniref:Putative xap5 domain containing protein n=1 Tax=Uncinula necator TaxID=52586 RepID=A0A0B1PEF5_UNCNE|nr:putative xap5 domain containing protein [Erysiphe necator]